VSRGPRARRPPPAVLLPDPELGRQLEERLGAARDKVEEIDHLLAQPGFSEAEVEARLRDLTDRGEEVAAAAACSRLHNLRRLRGLHDRFTRELLEVGELQAQLRTQAEVVRLLGSADDGTAELVAELVARVEGLDEVLDDEALAGTG